MCHGGLTGAILGGLVLASGVKPSIHVAVVSALMFFAIIFAIRNLLPQQVDAEKMAEKYDLLNTVGSDFHGKTKPRIKLGFTECNGNEQAIYEMLKEVMPV